MLSVDMGLRHAVYSLGHLLCHQACSGLQDLCSLCMISASIQWSTALAEDAQNCCLWHLRIALHMKGQVAAIVRASRHARSGGEAAQRLTPWNSPSKRGNHVCLEALCAMACRR
jgi:hypothetical protein